MEKEILKQAARFHGHLGPWLVLGLRAGRLGRRRLPGSVFELRARVECPAKPPVRCFIDGVQLGAGCTMGKGNITHRRWPDGCRVTFYHRRTGARITIGVRPELFERLRHPDRENAAGLARRIYRRRIPEVFTISEG